MSKILALLLLGFLQSCFVPLDSLSSKPKTEDDSSGASLYDLKTLAPILSGRHYVAVNSSAIALNCVPRNTNCFQYTFGWTHRIEFTQQSKILVLQQFRAGADSVEVENYSKNSDIDFEMIGEGEAIRYQQRLYVRFDDIKVTDIFLKGTQWSVNVPAQNCGDGETSGTWNNSVDINAEFKIRTTQRGIACGAFTMQYGEGPLMNESVKRISADRKWLWLREGVYRLSP